MLIRYLFDAWHIIIVIYYTARHVTVVYLLPIINGNKYKRHRRRVTGDSPCTLWKPSRHFYINLPGEIYFVPEAERRYTQRYHDVPTRTVAQPRVRSSDRRESTKTTSPPPTPAPVCNAVRATSRRFADRDDLSPFCDNRFNFSFRLISGKSRPRGGRKGHGFPSPAPPTRCVTTGIDHE